MDSISPNNDFELAFYVEERAAATGVYGAATGLTGGIGWVARTRGGSALGGITVALTERASAPGHYYGILQGADIATITASLPDRVTLYPTAQWGTDINGDAAPVRLERVRRFEALD